ncbi:hypothetical protein M9Y10_044659 [Tritrichomonas musculus]|uniref:Ubiquitin carboxyl-terminal hydrolase n=1 Tax=Tritrichomonas musculus TaxID=1915356 RepID=A0ABR2JVY3_9EUKA
MMNYKEETLNIHERFPISYLYNNKPYSTKFYSLGQVKFKFIISLSKNQLKISIERNKLNLAYYSIQIHNFQPNRNIIKLNIRFDKGQKDYIICLKEASEYITSTLYEIGFQIQSTKSNSKDIEDSKKQAKIGNYFLQTTEDYLGLPNQGATCYLNSLLQVLFHLKKFRKLIFQEKVENDESNATFCLQLLFRDLQLRKYRRSTRHLTNSLGWDRATVCTSQDVSEFYKFFFERIIKGAPFSLFEGEFNITVKNENLRIIEQLKEKFIQVMLKVEGLGNITESFQSFIYPFSYYDSRFKEEQVKQISFVKIPDVFTLVLRRFWFNDKSKQYEKLNSIMTFPEILSLDECGIDCCKSDYQLYAIIAHIGTMDSGHYVSFINPDLKGVWYEFDDNKVYKINKENVFDLCYGMNRMNAYMLLYVNVSKKDELFSKSLLTIPKNIEDYKYKVQKEPPIQFYMNNEEGIINNLQKNKPLFLNIKSRKSFPFNVGTTFSEVYKTIASGFNKDPNRIRIWNVHDDSLLNVFDKKQKLKKNENRCWFVQDISESELLLIDSNHFLAFLVIYIPDTKQKLFYLGSHQFCYTDRISSIEKVVSQKYFNKNIHLISFAFTKEKIIPLNDSSETFIHYSLISNGLFLIIQSQPDNKISFHDLKINIKDDDQNETDDIIEYKDVKDVNFDMFDSYMDYKLNQVTFSIFNYSNTKKPLFKICIKKGSSLLHLKNFIATNAGFSFNPFEDTILLFDKREFLDDEIMKIYLQKGNSQTDLYFIFYKQTKEIKKEDQMEIEIHYNDKQIKFVIDKKEPLKIIQKHLINNNIIPINKKLRFYLVFQSRIISLLNENDFIHDNKSILQIDEIPKDQLEDDIIILKVTQCIKDGNKMIFFGNPFFIGIKFDESCIHAKKKISDYIGCEINNLNILIQNDIIQKDNYRLLLDNENILDALDGNNELFAFFSL